MSHHKMFAIMGEKNSDKMAVKEEGHGLIQNFLQAQAKHHNLSHADKIMPLCLNQNSFEAMSVDEFMGLLVKS